MFRHQFVPGDFDETYCDDCDKHIDKHANIEGITHEDDLLPFGGESLSDITRRLAIGEDW